MTNLNTLSFLIASFNDTINNFGSNKKSMDFYRNQMNNLLNIGQIGQSEVDIICDLINFSYVGDDEKWKLELSKVAYFTSVMDVIISNSTDKKIVSQIVDHMQCNASTKEQKKALRVIRRVFGIEDTVIDDINMTGNSKFGTSQYKNINQKDLYVNNLIKNSTTDEDLMMRTKKALEDVVKDKRTIIRVQNIDACCSGDPSTYSFDIFNIFTLSKDMTRLVGLWSRGAKQHVGFRVADPDTCGHSSSWIENEEATKIIELFLKEYTNTYGEKRKANR